MKHTNLRRAQYGTAAVVMIVTAIAASWQLYCFVIFRNAAGIPGTQGGWYHLWLAVGAMLMASIAACLMFLLLPVRGTSKSTGVPLSALRPKLALIDVNPNVNSPTSNHVNAIGWTRQNEWWIEGQANDRQPMSGSAGVGAGTASAQRSAARLMHQVMYRKWARERHD